MSVTTGISSWSRWKWQSGSSGPAISSSREEAVYANTRDMERLTGDFLAGEDLLRLSTDASVLPIAQVVLDKARRVSAKHSTKIPASLSAQRRGTHSVAIVSSDPLARIYERGNRGASEDSTTFTHPVFGMADVVVEQDRYPFMKQANREAAPEAEALMVEAVRVAMRR
jgi:hypothetical protein